MPRKVMIVGLMIKNIEGVVADPKRGGSCPNNFRQINSGCLHGLWERFRVLATGGSGSLRAAVGYRWAHDRLECDPP